MYSCKHILHTPHLTGGLRDNNNEVPFLKKKDSGDTLGSNTDDGNNNNNNSKSSTAGPPPKKQRDTIPNGKIASAKKPYHLSHYHFRYLRTNVFKVLSDKENRSWLKAYFRKLPFASEKTVPDLASGEAPTTEPVWLNRLNELVLYNQVQNGLSLFLHSLSHKRHMHH
jgi:hypothetical protein